MKTASDQGIETPKDQGEAVSRSADRSVPSLFYGTNPERVIEAIKARAEQPQQNLPRDDGRKIALVVEGGSLRGVMSAGGMLALTRMGMYDVFDHIFATSAGVMNASYFLSRQPDLGISIYYEELASKLFINPRRLWKILDLDYVFDEVIVKIKPLDLEVLQRATTAFSVTMIDRSTGALVLVDAIRGPAPTLTCLKAATAIPVLYNRAVMIDGKPCIDGGLLNPLPVRDAIAAGCTDILVLLTQPAAYARQRVSPFARVMFELLCARGRRCLSQLLPNYPVIDHELRQLALGHTAPPEGVNIATLCPADGECISGYGGEGRALWLAAQCYCERTLRAFGRDDIDARIAPPRAGNSPQRRRGRRG